MFLFLQWPEPQTGAIITEECKDASSRLTDPLYNVSIVEKKDTSHETATKDKEVEPI